MALQLGALRDALIEAGATKEKADAAAEELAGYEIRLAGIDKRLAILQIMVGGLYAILALIGGPSIWLLVRVAAKVGALPG
jgi:hypothetical protein